MKPRLLDLFCKEGGAGKGYADAGFEVVGVDVEPQPRYPFEFHQGDALEWLDALVSYRLWEPGGYTLRDFAAVHASPPCQAHSRARQLQGNDHPDLIGAVRELLGRADLPYVIENVPGAPLEDPITLCGTMFGLPLYRHRLFESNVQLVEPLHGAHFLPQVKMGRRPGPGEIPQPVGHFSDVEGARAAMGTPWMTQGGMAEAIPPAYTQHIGAQLLQHVQLEAAA